MSDNNKLTFEEALLKLEKIVSSLDAGSLSLNDSIDAYEEARNLLTVCEERLDNAKQKVYILNKSSDGETVKAPFDDLSDET